MSPDGKSPDRGLEEIVKAIRASWDRDTAYATSDYLEAGRPGDRSRGQCGPTAAVVHDWLGGDIIVATLYVRGMEEGRHYWNRLADGVEIDLTRDQLLPDETLGPGIPVVRPPGPPRIGTDPYLLLSRRVQELLGRPQATS
jgi:hypothetical protein